MPVDQYENNFTRIADELGRKANLVVHKTVARIHAEADASFAKVKHGALYHGHRASAPGEAPAIDTGNLLNSGYHKMTGPTEGEVGFGAEYAVYLEMGSVRMAPRPFLGPAVERVWPEFVKAMERIP